MLSLAFDCGFNSKSSFNKYFKKETNLTPTEYIKLLT
ncbi:helix-turn-helix domain-containing protein [Gelidibacter algens]